MSPETIKSISDALAPVAEKIGEGGAYYFQLAVRQSYINGAEAIFGVIVFSIVSAVVLPKWYKWCFTKTSYGDYEGEWSRRFGFIVGCFFIAAVLYMMCTFAADSLLNPQYAALQNIISSVVPHN